MDGRIAVLVLVLLMLLWLLVRDLAARPLQGARLGEPLALAEGVL